MTHQIDDPTSRHCGSDSERSSRSPPLRRAEGPERRVPRPEVRRLTQALKEARDTRAEARRAVGQRSTRSSQRSNRRWTTSARLSRLPAPAGAVDVTLASRAIPVGRVHPLMRVRQQVEDIFTHMGYEILEGPEVEDDYHNFEALNMPPDHPARDMQDTLYLGDPIVGGTWGAHRGHCPRRRCAPRPCFALTRRRCRSAT